MNIRLADAVPAHTGEPGSTPARAWYVVQFKPNCAAIAQRQLSRQGFSTFLPRHRRTERRTGRFHEALRPLFPGYVFVSFDPSAGHWRAINSTPGVTRLVSFNARPAPLPEGLVEALQLRCDAQGLLRPVEALAVGDRARVTEGPFADFVVRIEAVSDDQRLWVLFDLMGCQSRVALPRTALSRA